jgi:hypothetical protein
MSTHFDGADLRQQLQSQVVSGPFQEVSSTKTLRSVNKYVISIIIMTSP